jgi:UDP-N-acetylglucosamine 2-epimerase (non-hydrolysing)
MLELDRRDIAYNFIDSGQHAGFTRTLINDFGLRDPDVVLAPSESSVSTIGQAVAWTSQMLRFAMAKPGWILDQFFKGQAGTCLIHGNTLTTILSLIYAKRAGMQVWHVEAGFRTHHLLDPFLPQHASLTKSGACVFCLR